MKIKLPKKIVGVKFPRICTIDMNDFDIDLFLPSLFFTILAQGKGKARQTNEPTEIAKFIDSLANHSDLEGFNDSEGRRVLERLVRTTLITTGGVGRSRTGEQITSIVPYTILAYKPGFPAHGSRQRSVDTFIYQILREHLGADDVLRNFVKKVFGHGVKINIIPDLDGSYDGEAKLDTLTRLSLAFLDGFKKPSLGSKSRESTAVGPCPALTKELAIDIWRYLFEYFTNMPTQAFIHHLLVLINFELFNYTLKLVGAVNELVQNPESLPVAMQESVKISPPQLYLDFTESLAYSQEMAKACVRRDIETYQQFLESNLLLRQLDLYVEQLKRNPRYRLRIEEVLQSGISGAEYLQGLLQLRNDPIVGRDIAASARSDEDEIHRVNTYEGEEVDQDSLDWLSTITDTAEDDIGRVVNLLVEGQKETAIDHFAGWYWGVGGLKKPQGVLRGTTLNRKSWRYAPTNDLLAVFVQLAAVRFSPPTNQDQGDQELQPIRLQDFLRFLEERFGILIDRPPLPFEGAEYVAAARENLRAMLSRLRQMGIFRDLSDDFTVQRLHPPYAGKESMKEEV